MIESEPSGGRDPGGREDLHRRRFLERMAALSGGALLAPATLSALPPHAEGGGAGLRTSSGGDRGRDPRVRLPAVAVDRGRAADPEDLTIVEAAHLLREGALDASELVEAYLTRIERWESTYRAFNALLVPEARAWAASAGRRLERVRRGLEGDERVLLGIPLAIKDNFLTAGVPTTANSHIFANFVPAYDATAWTRLREAGGILLGKTQMGPLATTDATTPDGERTTSNAWAPWDPEVSPGGSSSGSATAVAARLAACGTGTQTGGSITSPSNAQGLTGIKPTMGRVSLHGIIPLTYTRDHVGALARDARDAALMLQIMAGSDRADPRTMGLPGVPDYIAAVERPRVYLGAGGRRIRIGVFPDALEEPTPPPAGPPRAGAAPSPADARRLAERARRRRSRALAEVTARREMLETFRALGADVVELDPPAGWDTLTSWAFNNVRLPERSEIFLEHLRADVRRFGVSLSPWINGLLLPAAEYVRGSRARLALLRAILDDVFPRCDAVLQTAPFPFDMVGLPLVAFPVGFESDSAGTPLPVGTMLGGPPYGEDVLLALAAVYQRETEWHRRSPPDPDTFERPGGEGGRAGDAGSGRRYLDLFDVMEEGE